jgi:hypothetical protein
MNEIIEEIHETFYTEVDKLLAEARISNSLETDKQNLIDKHKRLKALGFINTKEVKEAKDEVARLKALENENKAKADLIEAINYFSQKYPLYKFITEESVKKICSKYNLVYGSVDRYIGTVPDENLKHMENFKISEEDSCSLVEECFNGVNHTFVRKEFFAPSNKQFDTDRFCQYLSSKCPLEIAAPLKDFNMTDSEVKDFKISDIEILDPVVLQPVVFKGTKYYLIVTAWGLEASDELVVNTLYN